MQKINRSLSRRSVVRSALLAPAAAFAAGPPSNKISAKIWSNEYWAHKGDVKLYMFRKRATAPKAGEKPLPVLFLIHGSSNSGRSSFDLATPGKGEYSVMNVFAGLGFDVWTMDHENYGHSSQTQSNSDIASGAQDIKAGMDVIGKETGAQKVHLFGESSGAIRVGVYAMLEPARVDRVVLGAFTYKGENSPTLTERAKGLEFYRTHNRRLRDRAMIRSIFTRDKPGTTDPAIAEFLADEELKFGDQVPTGTSQEGAGAGIAGARRIRRDRHDERHQRLLPAASQRRQAIRGAAGDGALGRARTEPAGLLAHDARFPDDAEAGVELTGPPRRANALDVIAKEGRVARFIHGPGSEFEDRLRGFGLRGRKMQPVSL